MSEKLNKLAQDLEKIVDSFIAQAQLVPLGGHSQERKGDVRDEFNKKYGDAIGKEVAALVQGMSDDLWNKTNGKESFGYFEIELKGIVKGGGGSVNFIISPNLGVNKKRNLALAKQLNRKLARKYTRNFNAIVKKNKVDKKHSNVMTLKEMSGNA